MLIVVFARSTLRYFRDLCLQCQSAHHACAVSILRHVPLPPALIPSVRCLIGWASGFGASVIPFRQSLRWAVSALSVFFGLVSTLKMCDRIIVLISITMIALGAFLASSESADSDVECFTDVDTEQEPMTMPGCK